ncbi:hypothetical protein HF319_09115 [Xanthomonas sp. Kuri4-1]
MATLRTSKAVPPSTVYVSPRENKLITHEQLHTHLQAFQQAGGVIERLGTTSTLKKIG